MSRLRVLSLATWMLMLASRLPGQLPPPQQGVPWDGQVVACNDGTITFSVGQAYRYLKPFLGYEWQFVGWYNVDPGKCQEIGSMAHYHNATFGKDSVTLLAFAFYDSTGTWGAIKLRPINDYLWHPSNQQFCVQREGFQYARDSPEGDLPRACDRGQTGYQMIPASFEYRGPVGAPTGYTSQRKDYLHVKLGPGDRAIPMGKQTSSGGPAPSQSNHSDSDHTLSVAAGIFGLVIVGTIIEQYMDKSQCNTPVPKPFEQGTMNAEILRNEVVRRTCRQADWYSRFADGRAMTVNERFGISDPSVGSILDPPQQVDDPGTRTPDSAQDASVRRIVTALDGMLGSRGGTDVTTYGKFRYKPVGDGLNEVWVNLVALDFSNATVQSQGTLSIPCVDGKDCALFLFRKERYIKGFSGIKLFMQGQGTWPEVLAQLQNLRTIFPKPPVVQAR